MSSGDSWYYLLHEFAVVLCLNVCSYGIWVRANCCQNSEIILDQLLSPSFIRMNSSWLLAAWTGACNWQLLSLFCTVRNWKTVRVRSHRHECESNYLYTGSSKHEFACISTAAVHIGTSSVRVRAGFKKPGFFLKSPTHWVLLGFFGQAGKIGKIIQKLSNLKP